MTRARPQFSGRDSHGHRHLDLPSRPVRAAHDGIVTITHGSRTAQGGLEVWLTSPELDGEATGNSRISTVYCHLDEYVVKVGDQLRQGDLIGYEGNTGFVVSGGTAYWATHPPARARTFTSACTSTRRTPARSFSPATSTSCATAATRCPT